MNPLKKLIVIILLSWVACTFFNFFVQKGLEKYATHINERMGELFSSKTYHDVIFIGSSRTHTNINPALIDSICKINSYNFGMDGGNLLEFYYVFKGYLEIHPPPRVLVLTLDLYSFNLKRRIFDPTLYFKYMSNPIVKEMLDSNGYSTATYKWMPFLLLTQQDDYKKANAFKGYRGIHEMAKGETQYKGFVTNSTDTININNSDVTFHTEEVNPLAIYYLNNIISTCKSKNIQLIFVYAPEYKFEVQHSCSNTGKIFGLINRMASNNNIPYLRDDSLSICSDPLLFRNVGHLNKPGANIYSAILAKQLKKIMN